MENGMRIRMDEPDMVKSAARALYVFDLFYEQRRPLSVMEIARGVSAPQSSVSEIVKCLVKLGYLTHDSEARTYFPSLRLGLVGEWLNETIFAPGGIRKLMRELHEATGDTVMLTTRKDIFLEALDVIHGSHAPDRDAKRGQRRTVTRSAMGHLLLSSYDDAFIDLLVRRINATEPRPERRVPLTSLWPIIEEYRAQGYAYAENVTIEGTTLVGMVLPTRAQTEPLVIGLAGPTERVRPCREQRVNLLRDAFRRHLGTELPGAF
jgi:DNA-binding IclR family transcriptional regulator